MHTVSNMYPGALVGGAAFKCGEEDLQGAKLCILSVTCIQGLRWGVQPSNVERRIYKGPRYAYCQ